MKGDRKDRREGRNEEVAFSKAMSKVLRHAAVEEGLTIDTSGYVHMQELLQYLRQKGFKNVDE
jgi:2'-phosphotransferase